MTEYVFRLLRLHCHRTTGGRTDDVLIAAYHSGGRKEELYSGTFHPDANLALTQQCRFRRSIFIHVTEEDHSYIGNDGNITDTGLDDYIGSFTASESDADGTEKVQSLRGNNSIYQIIYKVYPIEDTSSQEAEINRVAPAEDGRSGMTEQDASTPVAACGLNGNKHWVELRWRYAARDGETVGPPVSEAEFVITSTTSNWTRRGRLNRNGFRRLNDVPVPCSSIRYWFVNDRRIYEVDENYAVQERETYDIPITHYLDRWLYDDSMWLWGAVQGDFNKNPGLGQILFNTVLGLIPVVDQGFDARDTTANIIALCTADDAATRNEAWFNLGITAIGWIPEFGSVIKGVVRAIVEHGMRGGRALFRRLMAIMNEAGIGNSAGNLKTIIENLPRYCDQAFGYLRTILLRLKSKLEEIIYAVRANLSAYRESWLRYIKQWVSPIIDRIDRSIGEWSDQLSRFKERLARLTSDERGEFLTGPRRPRQGGEGGVDTRHTVHQQKTDVPLQNDVVPIDAPITRGGAPSGPATGGGGGGGPPVRSRYGDGTPVYQGQQPPRVNSPAGPQGPMREAEGPHSVIRWDEHNNRVYQGREYDGAGNPVRDVDFTNPTYSNGRPRPDHPGPPHQHRFEVNDPDIGPRSGFRRLGPEPIND